MDKGRAIQAIRAQEPVLRQAGIKALYLFGSTVRDQARDDSDVDILIDLRLHTLAENCSRQHLTS